MDQLRTALVWLKKYHFWVLSVLVALISLVCWAKASSKLTALFKTNESTITTEFNNVKNLRSDPFHPNEDVNAKQEAQTKKQAEDVAKLWKQLYDRQRETVLTWPVPPLSKEFGDYIEKLQFGDDIAPKWRSHYQNYVDGHFPELPRQIDARPLDPATPSGAGGGEFGGRSFGREGPGAMPGGTGEYQYENDYMCEWDAADQAIVRDDLQFLQRPSSLRIWVTQENLWVYHTMLDVIAKTNRAAGATRMTNAAVKGVSELAVGRRAAQFSRTPNRLLMQPPVAAAAGPGLGGEMGPGGPGPEGGMAARAEFSPESFGPGTGPMTEEQERMVLLSGRYLDAEGKPIPFGGGGAAPAEPQLSPDAAASAGPAPALDLTAFGQEYKRLPVRMVLWMNQRWLPRLISECASEPLQIEVQEVRVNVADAMGAGGGPGGFRGGEGGMGGAGGFAFPEEPQFQPFPTQPEMVSVIIQGTIYIFNKPNPAILQAPGGEPVASNGG